MAEETNNSTKCGYWYEVTPNGAKIVLCFKVKIHGKRVVKKLELPQGVSELKPLEVETVKI